jgi:hypothetical protein
MSLIHRITEKDELWVIGADIVTAGAAGDYSVVVDNAFPPGAVKAAWFVASTPTVHTDFAISILELRNAGATVPIAIGQIADGFVAHIYQASAVANGVPVCVKVIISR